jgi:multiple sugar transport system permease protein
MKTKRGQISLQNFAESLRRNQSLIMMYIVLIVFAAPFVYPFWWMISSSFKPFEEIFAYPPRLLPQTWVIENYQHVFEMQPFARQFANSFYIAASVTLLVLLLASLAGYAFARIRFRGNGLLFVMILSAIMMPAEVTIIPLFNFIQGLGLDNNHLPLIVLPTFGSAGVVATFMMRQYFLDLPIEVEEAAVLDGLSRWGIYWRIAMPLARPALMAVAILTFLHSWNLFLEPLVLLTDQNMFTLPLALRGYTDPYGQPLWGEQLAATTLSVIPVLIIYVFAQQHVVESFAFSGVKG